MKPIKPLIVLTTLAVVTLFASGCANVRTETAGSTQTAVSLNQNNYRMVKPGAIGTSHGFKLLGLLPVTSATASAARAHLYRDLGVDLQGKSTALANTTQDKSTFYLLLFSVPKITVQADVIEYVNPVNGSAQPASAPAQQHL